MRPIQGVTIHGVTLFLFSAVSVAAVAEPQPAYRSVFETYRKWQADLPLSDWGKANQDMAALGGHAGHVKPLPDDSKTSAPARQPDNAAGGKKP